MFRATISVIWLTTTTTPAQPNPPTENDELTLTSPCQDLGYCMVCRNAHSEADCFLKGRWQRLPSPSHVCYSKEVTLRHGRKVVSNGIKLISGCQGVESTCAPHSSGAMTCTVCGFPRKLPHRFFACTINANLSFCSCTGDPHCRQFWQSIQGPPLSLNDTCEYLLATDDCKGPGKTEFFIFASFGRRGGPGIFIKKLKIWFANRSPVVQLITLKSGGIWTSQDLRNHSPVNKFPHTFKNAVINKIGEVFEVTVPHVRVKVYWDGGSGVKVEAPQNHKVCGLCGHHGQEKNFTGFDLRAGPTILRDRCPGLQVNAKWGEMTSSIREFMHSWYVGDADGECQVHCRW